MLKKWLKIDYEALETAQFRLNIKNPTQKGGEKNTKSKRR